MTQAHSIITTASAFFFFFLVPLEIGVLTLTHNYFGLLTLDLEWETTVSPVTLCYQHDVPLFFEGSDSKVSLELIMATSDRYNLEMNITQIKAVAHFCGVYPFVLT